MNKFNKSEVLVLFVLALLLVITPLLPSSLRPTYLYFIFNVLIIALGAEAGLLSAFSKPLEDRKQPLSVTQKPVMPPEVHEPEERKVSNITGGSDTSEHKEKKAKVVEKCASDEKIIGLTKVDKVKKCPSMPSLLCIGGGEGEVEVMDEEFEAEDEVGGVNGQELFAKAEAFIGNFYKQLKMQREETWVYQEAF
ncbi:uncharacterized protein LOC113874569 [Abrus precatorius]|uniref:Uncharacterized protein LOC113874569 n=1 Tax=Abrus precatorius TaxID=3816 RepID=A0A8B8MJ29_ABRPR|nr:uncharacterized protein LOC113874569 [Abrus precatorius]